MESNRTHPRIQRPPAPPPTSRRQEQRDELSRSCTARLDGATAAEFAIRRSWYASCRGLSSPAHNTRDQGSEVQEVSSVLLRTSLLCVPHERGRRSKFRC